MPDFQQEVLTPQSAERPRSPEKTPFIGQFITHVQRRSQILADMLIGACRVLENRDNPDCVPQAAFSLREFINNMPEQLTGTKISGSTEAVNAMEILCKEWDEDKSENHESFLKLWKEKYKDHRYTYTKARKAWRELRSRELYRSRYQNPEDKIVEEEKKEKEMRDDLNAILHRRKVVEPDNFLDTLWEFCKNYALYDVFYVVDENDDLSREETIGE